MAWTTPHYSKEQIDAAGQALIDHRHSVPILQDNALTIVNNWRSSHAFPLNTMQVYLRQRSRQIDSNSLVSQRVKRLSSIESKLRRLSWLKLSEMQDLGGCRVVARSATSVEKIVESYYRSQIKHRLLDVDDYVTNPKKSGYRGYHLIYGYHSDKKATYNGQKIELQIRSNLQHIWATAVETVGTFTQQALKSSQGERDWLRFFTLMSTYFAMRERRPVVPGTIDDHDSLVDEIRTLESKLEVNKRLEAYGAVLSFTDEISKTGNVRYFLLILDLKERKTTVRGFRSTDLDEASAAYLEAEQALSDTTGDAVLVSAESLASVRRAYPNYFLDTTRFSREVERALSHARIR